MGISLSEDFLSFLCPPPAKIHYSRLYPMLLLVSTPHEYNYKQFFQPCKTWTGSRVWCMNSARYSTCSVVLPELFLPSINEKQLTAGGGEIMRKSSISTCFHSRKTCSFCPVICSYRVTPVPCLVCCILYLLLTLLRWFICCLCL